MLQFVVISLSKTESTIFCFDLLCISERSFRLFCYCSSCCLLLVRRTLNVTPYFHKVLILLTCLNLWDYWAYKLLVSEKIQNGLNSTMNTPNVALLLINRLNNIESSIFYLSFFRSKKIIIIVWMTKDQLCCTSKCLPKNDWTDLKLIYFKVCIRYQHFFWFIS